MFLVVLLAGMSVRIVLLGICLLIQNAYLSPLRIPWVLVKLRVKVIQILRWCFRKFFFSLWISQATYEWWPHWEIAHAATFELFFLSLLILVPQPRSAAVDSPDGTLPGYPWCVWVRVKNTERVQLFKTVGFWTFFLVLRSSWNSFWPYFTSILIRRARDQGPSMGFAVCYLGTASNPCVPSPCVTCTIASCACSFFSPVPKLQLWCRVHIWVKGRAGSIRKLLILLSKFVHLEIHFLLFSFFHHFPSTFHVIATGDQGSMWTVAWELYHDFPTLRRMLLGANRFHEAALGFGPFLELIRDAAFKHCCPWWFTFTWKWVDQINHGIWYLLAGGFFFRFLSLLISFFSLFP